jgi:hypothetical protein
MMSPSDSERTLELVDVLLRDPLLLCASRGQSMVVAKSEQENHGLAYRDLHRRQRITHHEIMANTVP